MDAEVWFMASTRSLETRFQQNSLLASAFASESWEPTELNPTRGGSSLTAVEKL